MHRAVPELDAGEIVAEVRLPVRTKSMHELMNATFSAAGPMVAQALDRIEAGSWTPVDTAGRPTGYYRAARRTRARICLTSGNFGARALASAGIGPRQTLLEGLR